MDCFGGLESAVTYQSARCRNAVARIAPFKLKCAKHMFPKGSIHPLDYDEDVFYMRSELIIKMIFLLDQLDHLNIVVNAAFDLDSRFWNA